MLIFLAITTASAQDIFQRASFGTPQTVRLNLVTSTVNATDSFGQTPLMYAASNNPDPEVITALVQAGADVNIRTPEGWTALMYAARDNSNPAVATRLLQFGAEPTLVNNEGFTAGDYATRNANLQGVPMTTPIEMPMPDPASFNNPAAFVRPNRVPFVAAPYRSPFDGVSPEFIVPGEFGAVAPVQGFVQGARVPMTSVSSVGIRPSMTPPITRPMMQSMTPSVTMMPPPTSATQPYYPPAVAATPVPSVMPTRVMPQTIPAQTMPAQTMPAQTMPVQTMPNRAVPNPFAPRQAVPNTPFMPSAPRFVPGFEGISPEFIVPGEFGMGFVPPALGQVNMAQATPVIMTSGQTLPAPSFVTPQPRLHSPIALSNAPVTAGRFAPNVPTYAGGSAATIANRSAIGAGYERVPVRYSSSLLPDTARVIYGNVRYNPFLPLRDCSEFATQVSAQAFYLAAGGPLIDRHGLDADGNGVACETLP
jgi:hypothetical protein